MVMKDCAADASEIFEVAGVFDASSWGRVGVHSAHFGIFVPTEFKEHSRSLRSRRIPSILYCRKRFAIEVACRYPDGTNVLCVAISELSDGRIAAQRIVQAWDH